MREVLSDIILRTIRSLGKWIIVIFGGVAGYVVLILQVIRPSSLQLALVEIIIPPVGIFLILFVYEILRKASELSKSLSESRVKLDELSTHLDEATYSLGIMEHKLRSVGGGILQKWVDVRTRLDIDGTWHRDAHIEIEVTEGTLYNLYHYNSIALSKGVFFQEYAISFKELYCEPNSKIRCDILKRPNEVSPNQVDINLTFSPPLSKGGKATYEYHQTYKGTSAMTREEADKAKLARNVFRNEGVEIDGYRILCETERIRRQIAFPRGYDISSLRIAVLYRGNRIELEEDRARQFFKAQLLDDCWLLEWDLTEPKLWHTYYFIWLPPPESEYRELLLKSNRN